MAARMILAGCEAKLSRNRDAETLGESLERWRTAQPRGILTLCWDRRMN